MIRILFVVENLGSGGAEKVLVNLVNNMDREKFDMTVMTLFSGGVNVKRLLPEIKYIDRHKHKFKGVARIIRYIPNRILYNHYVGKGEFDIVVAYMTGMPTKIVAGSPYKKIGWLHADFKKKDLPSLKIIGNEKKIAECYKKFSAIVGVSKFIVDTFSERVGIKNRLHLIYNTNETEEIINKSKQPASFPFDTEGLPVVISVGKLDPIKGYSRLFKIASDLFGEGYKFKLCIIGEGKSREDLERIIAENDLSKNVFLLGFDENPYKYLSISDIFVCSSFSEGLSTATTEALLLGLPIVSTDVSGAREILGDNNEWGIVTGVDDDSLYEGLKKMLSDPALREYYREATKERAPFFDKKNTVAQAEKLFYEVMRK